MEAFKVQTKNQAPGSTTLLFVFHSGTPNQATLEITHTKRRASVAPDPEGILGRLPPSPSNGEGRVTMTLGGKSVPHLPGEPYSCHIHQVGRVTFNPRKQVRRGLVDRLVGMDAQAGRKEAAGSRQLSAAASAELRLLIAAVAAYDCCRTADACTKFWCFRS